MSGVRAMQRFNLYLALACALCVAACERQAEPVADTASAPPSTAPAQQPDNAAVPVQGHPDPLSLLASDDPVLARNKRLVFDFWRSVVNAGHVEVADDMLTEGYMQHSPVLRTGRTAFKEIFSVVPRVDPIPELVSPPLVAIIAEGDLVAMTLAETLPNPDGQGTYTSTHFNLFRIEDGRLAEHWHSVQTPPGADVPLPEDGGPHLVTGAEGTAQLALLQAATPELASNKRLVFDVWRQIIDAGHEELADLYLGTNYIQHNPNAATGRDGFKAYFSTREDAEIATSLRDPLVAMVAEGDLVVQALKFEYPHPVHAGRVYTTTWFDMFRIADHRLAEHWDGAVKAAAAVETAAAANNSTACADEAGISYVCGLLNAEDMLRIGDSDWLLASGMAGNSPAGAVESGTLYLVNARDHEWSTLFPGTAPVLAHDTAMYPDCPGPLDVANFSAHGLALQNFPEGSQRYRLYMTSHGAREAIETFELDLAAEPRLTWTGCVPLPATVWANSVVILRDGGFLTTQFMDPAVGFAPVLKGDLNGRVLEWHPGGEVRFIEGTELSGPNGIALSNDERHAFVAEFGGRRLVRFDLGANPVGKTQIDLGIVPDNVRWSESGKLYTAGGNVEGACEDASGADCGPGWSVWEIDPATLAARRVAGMPAGSALPSVSSALPVGNEIWIGTPAGDRVGILPLP
jgi:predicted SnoaL-like aldol condensation-catalyzing enzyme